MLKGMKGTNIMRSWTEYTTSASSLEMNPVHISMSIKFSVKNKEIMVYRTPIRLYVSEFK